jgi:uncharacterized coiled-coil protein SlyX
MSRMRSIKRNEVARPHSAHATLALVSLALLAPSYAAAADNEDTAELRRMLREVQAQNRELSRRLGALESAREAPAASRTKPASPKEARAEASSAVASPGATPRPPEPTDTSELGIEDRVKELETKQAAQENATRQIIRDTLSKTGPKINNYLALSGVVEMVGSRSRDFNGPTKSTLALSTTELDFDVKLSNWLTGSLVLSYETGTSTIFPTNTATSPSIDRMTIDRTHISIGDFTQFPISARLGREVLHFGTSTGVARLDTLSIGTPLTTEVFENRQAAAGLEFALPTPPLAPAPAPVIVPPVRPLVVAPAVERLARWLGYTPLPQRVGPPAPVAPPVAPPPFYGSFLVYKGSELLDPGRRQIQDYNASLGYRTSGHCGKPYEELKSSWVCPWHIDVHVDYNTSVFDSRFLSSNYLPFLSQIGSVPGVAASVKASFGPFALVGEVNSATRDVIFLDGLGAARNIKPMTWQGSLAYQFDWNPWITEIGAQGNFISVAYSGSRDMAGAIALISGVPTRVGFVPQHRLLFTGGEWVMDGLKLAMEYSANWDYPQSAGGTGQVAHGVFGSVQLNF